MLHLIPNIFKRGGVRRQEEGIGVRRQAQSFRHYRLTVSAADREGLQEEYIGAPVSSDKKKRGVRHWVLGARMRYVLRNRARRIPHASGFFIATVLTLQTQTHPLSIYIHLNNFCTDLLI